MRLVCFFAIFSSLTIYSQKVPFSKEEIKKQISYMQEHAVFVDSLHYVEDGCQYFDDSIAYKGFIYHLVDETLTFNYFRDGKYTGEEWIFDTKISQWNSDSLVNSLREFRTHTSEDQNFMNVTTYFDFKSDKIHEIYIDPRYLCAKRQRYKEAFDVIFGGDERHRYPYRSFYENGKKERIQKRSKRGLKFYKKLDEEGKCVYRYKYRGEDPKGLYAISNGKIILRCFFNYRMNEDKRRKKRIERYNKRRNRKDK